MVQFIKYFQRLSLTILLCFFLVQCSSDSTPEQAEYIYVLDEIPKHIQEVENVTVFPGDAEPAYSIELIPDQTYGKSGEPYLTRVLRCVVDDKGRVIIWDGGDYTSGYPFIYRLYAYNPDGTYHTQVGGPGEGPGEYGMPSGVHAEAGKVFLFDYTGLRLNVYNTDDYSFERTSLIERWPIRDHEAAKGLNFGGAETRKDGNHLVMFYEPNPGTDRPVHTYLLMDSYGNALEFEPLAFPSSLNVIKENSMVPSSFRPMPFMGATITGLSADNALYSAWTQDFLIKKYDARGVYQSAIYYQVEGSPLDLSDYTEEYNYSRSDVINTLELVDEELPESNPVIADMKVDDENRIWVAVPTEGKGDTYEWWILKESGELLAKLLLPRHQPIFDIQNGYLYSKETNEETGAEYAVRYRIELTER